MISDGGLASFVAAAIEAEAALRRGEAGGGPGPVLWFSAVGVSEAGPVPEEAAEEAVRKQGAVLGLGVEVPDVATAITLGASGDPAPVLLVLAADRAARLGLRRVVWPALAMRDGRGEPDLNAVASILDRALLAGRLADTGAAGAMSAESGVSVEAPLADLTDRQVAELAKDFALPLGPCWWSSGPGEWATAERSRWGGLLGLLGRRAGVDAAAAGV